MKTTLILPLCALIAPVLAPAADIPPAEVQIAATLLAAPEEYSAGAAVLGYDSSGALVTLREGSNEMICLADDPKRDGFSAACYHKDLEPFMARGRELIAEGITGAKRDEIRGKEEEENKLKMPREPRTLYVLTGSSYDATAGKLNDSYLRWVIYVPFATPESTGLSTKASPGAPWLMFPGKAGAHIMINPPKAKN
ncbi:MAG: hypothetical protein KIT09_25325 [Bryobacteraceae bacterium]|nr:hypothetical protein [Bryobacteraceae bacterium]